MTTRAIRLLPLCANGILAPLPDNVAVFEEHVWYRRHKSTNTSKYRECVWNSEVSEPRYRRDRHGAGSNISD